MSMTVMNMILGISIGVLAISFLMMIDWRKMAAKWVANNPAKARVYVAAGEQIDSVDGKLYYPGVKGSIYRFKWHKISLAIYVKSDYPFKYLTTSGKRMINAYAGNGVAVSWLEAKIKPGKTLPDDIEKKLAKEHAAAPLDWSMPTDHVTVNAVDLDAVIRSNIGVRIVDSLFGHRVNIIMTIIVLAAVLVGGFFVVKNVMFPDTVAPVTQETQPGESLEEALREQGALP